MKSWKEKSDPASLGSYRRASVSARGRYRDRVQSAGRKNRSRAPMLRLRSVRSAQARVLVLRRLLARTLAVSLRESEVLVLPLLDRKSTRLNSSHLGISYAVFCLK